MKNCEMKLSNKLHADNKFWKSRKIKDVCLVIPGQHILEMDYNRNGSGIGYLTGPADFGEIYPEVSRWTDSPKVLCNPGDVLITVKGAGVGKANLSPTFPVAIGRQLMAIRPNLELVDLFYLFFFIQHQFSIFQDKAQGATVPGLDKDNIESLPIPIPALLEQKRISAIIKKQLDAKEIARKAIAEQIQLLSKLNEALIYFSLISANTEKIKLDECLDEITHGIGESWENYRVLGVPELESHQPKKRLARSLNVINWLMNELFSTIQCVS